MNRGYNKLAINRQKAGLERKSKYLRRKILEMVVCAKAGHIAPCFSCVDILTALYYGGILHIKPEDLHWERRDRFILSKGHAVAALYVILADLGFFPEEELVTFNRKGSRLGGHPEHSLPGIEVSTGSLGHGLSIAAGLALAGKWDKKNYLCVTLLGDGECQEGSVWEAAMFSAHHRLSNLVAIIDYNRLSATDFIEKYLDISPLREKWKAFGWEVVVVNGHSFVQLLKVFLSFRLRRSNKPLAVIALTTKGKGVSFMENKPIWHYRVPQGEELETARKELSLDKR